jgi:hypothetical protein
MSPLRRIETALAAALIGVGAAQLHPFEGVWAAAIVVAALEFARLL